MFVPAWCELGSGHGILVWRSTAGTRLTGLMYGIEMERNPDRGVPATRGTSPGSPDRASQGRENRSGGGCWSGSGIRLTDASDLGMTIRGVPFSHVHVRVGAEVQQVAVCDAGRERDVGGAGGRPAGALWTMGAVAAVLRHDNLSGLPANGQRRRAQVWCVTAAVRRCEAGGAVWPVGERVHEVAGANFARGVRIPLRVVE